MNKVFNWTVGSFFRTIGRMLAFFITGIAIAYILSQSDLKIGNIFRYTLGVHASEITNHWLGEVVSPSNTWNYSSLNAIYMYRNLDTYTTYQSDVRFENSFSGNGLDKVFINGYITGLDLSVHDFECSQIASSGNFTYCKYTENLNNLDLQIWLGNAGRQCKMSWNNVPINTVGIDSYLFWQAECFLEDNQSVSTISYRINAQDHITSSHSYQLGINRSLFYSKSDSEAIINAQSQTTQAITNQTQQDQQQHEEIMDSNTTQAEDDAQDFFENFDAPDVGGLSAIITAPLSTIQSLLNATCTNLVLPLPYVNKNLTLPCMNDIYTEHFGAFFTLYQTIILGIIAYRCIRSIFFDLQGFADPSDDRIEVIDL